MKLELQLLDLIQVIRAPASDRSMCAVTRLGDAGILCGVVSGVIARWLLHSRITPD